MLIGNNEGYSDALIEFLEQVFSIRALSESAFIRDLLSELFDLIMLRLVVLDGII